MFGIVAIIICSIALLFVRRRWAILPLLLGATFISQSVGVNIGPVWMPSTRILLTVGLLRILLRGERPNGVNKIDHLMVAFGCWILFASLFHDSPSGGPLAMIGVVANVSIAYLLVRTFCSDLQGIVWTSKQLIAVMAILAVLMVLEVAIGKNVVSLMLGGEGEALFRDGRLRARGPFRHPILAGTAGAVCFPYMVALWSQHRKAAIIGGVSCLLVVLASSSSGPVMTLIFGIMGMVMWKYRQHMRLARIGFVVLYIFLDMTMSRPAYYLISRINVTGSSTGWHRSLLIDRAIQNFSEWWLVGTDVTRHWMPTGVSFSTEHTDITNYYLQFGVWAGILAVILLISILWTAFRGIGQILSIYKDEAEHTRFLVWCLGAALFAHACTSISVAYYDQSFLFFWFNVAVISSLLSAARQEQAKLVPVKSTKLSWKPRLAAPQTT